MINKDYYKILEVSQSATPLAIKQAYRRLALKYHPDRNDGDTLLEQKFKEVSEAYKILSDTKKRSDYNYSRWGKQTADQAKTYTVVTVAHLLTTANKLKNKIANSDPHRLNDRLLINEIFDLLSKSNIKLLIEKGQDKERYEVITSVLFVCRYLPYIEAQKVLITLMQLAHGNHDFLFLIKNVDNELKYRSLWNHYKLLIVLIVVMLLCIFIYFVD